MHLCILIPKTTLHLLVTVARSSRVLENSNTDSHTTTLFNPTSTELSTIYIKDYESLEAFLATDKQEDFLRDRCFITN